jgi:hypothetical protein
MLELLVAAHGSARFRAGAADFGARPAGHDVIWRPTKHEVRARLTHLGTVEQKADEIDLAVQAPNGETVLHGHRAHGMTIHALLDALLQLFVRLLVCFVAVIIGFLHIGLRAGE